MAQLELTNVINISVSAAGAGIGALNTSNVALFTSETPAGTFPSDGYSIYLSPSQVGLDFGTDSDTYKMAIQVFSQQPNILANNGYLVVIPFLSAETLAEAITRTKDVVQYFGVMVAGIVGQTDMLDAAAVIQTLNKIAFFVSRTETDVDDGGLLDLLRTGSLTQSRGLFYGSQNSTAVQFINFPTLPTAGAYTLNYGSDATTSLAFNATAGAVETALQALTGLSTVTVTGSRAVGFTVTFTGVDGAATLLTVTPNTLTNASSNPVIPVVTNQVVGVSTAQAVTLTLQMMASYVGRALSTNFNGSNTTQTMQLKDLIGVQPDPSMTQTLYNKCQLAGVDIYSSIQGVSKVLTSGANSFFDQVYNLQWFIIGLQVAGFNFLAQSSTKVPQTENGISALKAAYRTVCEQGVTNQYIAPGTWTSPTTFGNLEDFVSNVLQRGYYIYSAPIGLQSPVARAARQAPLIQIAVKEAGAVHSSNVLINVNV